jgi:hypothetical protein
MILLRPFNRNPIYRDDDEEDEWSYTQLETQCFANRVSQVFVGINLGRMLSQTGAFSNPLQQTKNRQDAKNAKKRRGTSGLTRLASAAISNPDFHLARAVPIGVGLVVLISGALQFSAWKMRHLACCREEPGRDRTLPADTGSAWRHGLRLGLHCSYCCAGFVAILLVIGVMDLRAMALVAAALTIERLAPAAERVARAIGAIAVGAGFFLIARAAGLV